MPEFQLQQAVVKRTTRDAVGTVVAGPRRTNAQDWFRVRFGGVSEWIVAEDLEAAIESLDVYELVQHGRYASWEALVRGLTISKLRKPLRDALYSLGQSRTEFHAYQFKPLLKFLSSDRQRILIADEVGLGKTIEAGYILQEQKARHDIDRVLIVCPASLRHKWRAEMSQRFGEPFDILDSAGFRRWITDADPPTTSRAYKIVSLQTVRSERILELLDQRPVQLDLLIVDEAHHVRNRETDQYKAVRNLCFSSDATVFLTATPLHLRNEDLYTLLNLLLPEDFDRLDVFEERLRCNQHIVKAEAALRSIDPDRLGKAMACLQKAAQFPDPFNLKNSGIYLDTLKMLAEATPENYPATISIQESISQLNLLAHVMTRTKKNEAYPDSAKRSPVVHRVELTETEREIYDRVYGFCAEYYARAMGDVAAQFPLITLQRQLASSIPAMLAHYRAIIEGGIEARVDAEVADSADESDEEYPSSTFRLGDDPHFRGLIQECLQLPLGTTDTKFAELLKVVRTADKIVVFSYFRGSLAYLERRLLDAQIGCVRIDGSVPYNPDNPEEDQRQQRIQRFRDDPEVQVLLSSEVGSEGLDFQFCHTMANWDLPWNPMVVEQRIGRLDRLGQRSAKIIVVNFTIPGTIEDRILNRLYHRVGLFEGAIGPLEPILGQQIKELTGELLNPRLSPAEIDQIVERRALTLERRLKDERRFEHDGQNLIGQDTVFLERLEKIRRLGKYISARELRLFVTDFLRSEIPDAPLRPRDEGPRGRDAGDGCEWLRITQRLRELMRQQLPVNDVPLSRFLERGIQNDLRVTFNPDVALGSPTTEHIHGQHPLVRSILKFYEHTPDRIPPLTRAVVRNVDLAPAVYLFAWAEVSEEGLQGGRAVWVESICVETGEFLGEQDSEELLHQAVVSGESWEEFESPESNMMLSMLTSCEERLSARVLTRREEAIRQNAVRVDSQLASLDASFRAKLNERQARLDYHRARGNERVIPLFEAQIRKLEAIFAERKRLLADRRKVAVSYSLAGAGLLRVVCGQQHAPILDRGSDGHL